MANTLLETSLLPIASKREEHAIDNVANNKLALDLSPITIDPSECDAKLLPWLAYQWRVTITGLSEKDSRRLISTAKEIHQYKGTVYAVKLALSSVFDDSTITEFTDERAFEFDAKVNLRADVNSVYDAEKFNTARNLINDAKNARSRFINFEESHK